MTSAQSFRGGEGDAAVAGYRLVRRLLSVVQPLESGLLRLDGLWKATITCMRRSTCRWLLGQHLITGLQRLHMTFILQKLSTIPLKLVSLDGMATQTK